MLTLPQTRASARESFKALLTAANNDDSVRPPRTFGQAAQLTRSASHAFQADESLLLSHVSLFSPLPAQRISQQGISYLPCCFTHCKAEAYLGIHVGTCSLKTRVLRHRTIAAHGGMGIGRHASRMGAGVQRSFWSAGQPMTGYLRPCPPWRVQQRRHLSCNPAWPMLWGDPTCQLRRLVCLKHPLHHQELGQLMSSLW